ncbi:MAG: alkaline phosphatase D family protein, partial [Caulobacterales bacterium]
AHISLLDTREIGRDEQLDYQRDMRPLVRNGVSIEQAAAQFKREKLDDPSRSMLGAEQETWLTRDLARSKARGQIWQILAQQVVFSQQIASTGLSRLLPANASPTNWFATSEQMRQYDLPWNLDAWDGYPAARARLKASLVANANNAIIIGGDSHNAWVYNSPAAGGARLAAIEFAGGSISSPGFERSLTNAAPGERERVIQSGDPNLVFSDFTNRGYGALKLTHTTCEAEWRAVSDIRERTRGPVRATKFVSQASATAGPGTWTMGA